MLLFPTVTQLVFPPLTVPTFLPSFPIHSSTCSCIFLTHFHETIDIGISPFITLALNTLPPAKNYCYVYFERLGLATQQLSEISFSKVPHIICFKCKERCIYLISNSSQQNQTNRGKSDLTILPQVMF